MADLAAAPSRSKFSVDEERLLLLVWFVVLGLAWWRFAAISGGRTFQYDEWNFVLNRWRFEIDSFLRPHNSHLSLLPAAIFFVLFRTAGLDNYGVYQAAGYLTHFTVATLLLHLAMRRIGIRAALPVATAFVLLGSGAENSLWPFQIGSMASLAGFLLALVALDSDDYRAPRLVATGLCVSLASAGFGVVAVAGVALEVVLLRRVRKYAVSVLVPASLWFVWYVSYGTSEMQGENIPRVPEYLHESYAGAVAALVRAPLAWGFVVAWLLLVALLVVVVRRPLQHLRVVTLAATISAYWVLTALSRAQYWAPLSSRYVYLAAPILLLLVVELARWVDRRTAAAGLLVFAAWSVTSTWEAMSAHARWLREWGESVGMELRVLDSRLDVAPGDYRPDSLRAPDIYADPYRAAITGLSSSPAFDDAGSAAASRAARADADRVLYELGAITIETAETAVVCDPATESAGELLLRPGSQLVMLTTGPAEIGLRALGDEPLPATRVQAPGDRAVRVTVDARLPEEQWRLMLLSADARACFGS